MCGFHTLHPYKLIMLETDKRPHSQKHNACITFDQGASLNISSNMPKPNSLFHKFDALPFYLYQLTLKALPIICSRRQ